MNIKFSKMPPNLSCYFKSVNKIIKKKLIMKKQNNKGPDNLLADGHDICNYIARYGITNFQIQTIMKLDGRLDFDKLSRAVRLSVDAEPVLGCRFVESNPPYWKRLDNIDNVKFCSFEETDNVDEAIQQFLESPLDMDNDPMVKVGLIRSDAHDTLCVKLNHTCSDGAGAKEYLQLLSEIYSCIYNKNDNFIPKPSIRNSKDHEKLFCELGIKNPSSPWHSSPEGSIPLWIFPWKNKQKDNISIAVCRLTSDEFDEISRYAKSKGATINDLVLTAFYRSMFKKSNSPYGVPMHIALTVDLRRFLPDKKADAIRNFSGGIDTKLSRKVHETFEGTLYRVIHRMNKAKKGRPGLENALAAERIEKLNFRQFRTYFKAASKISKIASLLPYNFVTVCAPGLSNLGIISKKLLKFGDKTVIDAYVVAPAIHAPGFLLVVSTYNKILTLTVCYYKTTISRNYVESLLNRIKDELIKGCRH